jgi:hypothetical protein
MIMTTARWVRKKAYEISPRKTKKVELASFGDPPRPAGPACPERKEES